MATADYTELQVVGIRQRHEGMLYKITSIYHHRQVWRGGGAAAVAFDGDGKVSQGLKNKCSIIADDKNLEALETLSEAFERVADRPTTTTRVGLYSSL